MNRILKRIIYRICFNILQHIIIYSLLNLEKVSLGICILLIALTYYINKKEIFKAKVNKSKENLKMNILVNDNQFTAMTEKRTSNS